MTGQYGGATADPRILVGVERNLTGNQVSDFSVEKIEVQGDDLTESVQTLANQTGYLHKQLELRPIKYSSKLYDLGEGGYRLCEPITIVVEEYNDESVITRFPSLEVFGEGETEAEALIQLRVEILDLYDELVEFDSEEMGDLPKMWLRILNMLIERI